MLKKLLMSVAVSTALVAGMSAQAADKPLKIGAIMPMTGALAAYGETSLKGAELAVEEINEAGGVLGMPIELAVEDAQTEPQAGVAAANKLANIDGVAAFVGALSSGVTIPIATSVARPNKIPMISPASTSPVLTTLNDDGFLFRTVASDAIQGVAMAQVARDRGIDKVGIIYVNNDYGKGLADAFSESFEELGGEVTHAVSYEEKQSSYRAALQKAWGDGSTPYLVLIAYVGDGETVLRQSLEGGMFDKFIFSDGMKTEQLIENIGQKYTNGSVGTTAQAEEGTPSAEAFDNAYKEKYGKRVPQPYIDTTYDAVYLLALAAQKAGTTTDGPAIRDALYEVANPPGEEILPGEFAKAVELLKDGQEINWTGAAGQEDFDEHGDISSTVAEWEMQGDTIKTIRVFDPLAKNSEGDADESSNEAGTVADKTAADE